MWLDKAKGLSKSLGALCLVTHRLQSAPKQQGRQGFCLPCCNRIGRDVFCRLISNKGRVDGRH